MKILKKGRHIFNKLKRFIKVIDRVVKNSHELFQNFHSRLLENTINSFSTVDFIKGVFSSFAGNPNKTTSIKGTHALAEGVKSSLSLQNQISKRKPERVHVSLNGNQLSYHTAKSNNQVPKREINLQDLKIDDEVNHQDSVAHKVKSNILKELNVQNMQNKSKLKINSF